MRQLTKRFISRDNEIGVSKAKHQSKKNWIICKYSDIENVKKWKKSVEENIGMLEENLYPLPRSFGFCMYSLIEYSNW